MEKEGAILHIELIWFPQGIASKRTLRCKTPTKVKAIKTADTRPCGIKTKQNPFYQVVRSMLQ
jgi:hypothetical protein